MKAGTRRSMFCLMRLPQDEGSRSRRFLELVSLSAHSLWGATDSSSSLFTSTRFIISKVLEVGGIWVAEAPIPMERCLNGSSPETRSDQGSFRLPRSLETGKGSSKTLLITIMRRLRKTSHLNVLNCRRMFAERFIRLSCHLMGIL